MADLLCVDCGMHPRYLKYVRCAACAKQWNDEYASTKRIGVYLMADRVIFDWSGVSGCARCIECETWAPPVSLTYEGVQRVARGHLGSEHAGVGTKGQAHKVVRIPERAAV